MQQRLFENNHITYSYQHQYIIMNFSVTLTSILGAITLHGPHHCAKKSTTTRELPASVSFVSNSF